MFAMFRGPLIRDSLIWSNKGIQCRRYEKDWKNDVSQFKLDLSFIPRLCRRYEVSSFAQAGMHSGIGSDLMVLEIMTYGTQGAKVHTKNPNKCERW